jgi:uncharacterized protein (TIGR03084 family)
MDQGRQRWPKGNVATVDAQLLADLVEEQSVLDRLLTGSDASWDRPTPAAGWTVADTVRHLVVSDRAATASLIHQVDPVAVPGDGRDGRSDRTDDDDLLRSWREVRSRMIEAFDGREDRERVPWGGRAMAARSLATARVMETWSHGLDCFAAAGVEPVDTDRLVHVAWLGWKTLPYAYGVAGVVPPTSPDQLRLELRSPSGDWWTFGPPDAHSSIRGDAGDWCRVATHRDRSGERGRLSAEGDLAGTSMRVARAFL